MKVKKDFVTNSSSTNFCIIGTSFDSGKLRNNDLCDLFESEASKLGLETHVYCDVDSDIHYVGVDVHKVDKDKTLNEVIKEVKVKLDLLNESFKIKELEGDATIISDGWYNG